MTRTCVVYWLRDAQCSCPWRHGYIGISVNLTNRLRQHRRADFPSFVATVLFRGTQVECLALECKLRPTANIGWNRGSGGAGCPVGSLRSAETKRRMSEAAKLRYSNPEERARMSNVQKGRKITWGAKIAAGKLGSKLSDVTRGKMSAVRKGRPAPPRTPEHRAKLAAAKKGMKMPWIAESNRRRARKKLEISP